MIIFKILQITSQYIEQTSTTATWNTLKPIQIQNHILKKFDFKGRFTANRKIFVKINFVLFKNQTIAKLWLRVK